MPAGRSDQGRREPYRYLKREKVGSGIGGCLEPRHYCVRTPQSASDSRDISASKAWSYFLEFDLLPATRNKQGMSVIIGNHFRREETKYLGLTFLVASLLAMPATAQRHPMGRMGQMSHRNNT